jgi:EAL domain-containing protein (putative c-di-GMP-specific phosphodiesterase class I)
VQALILDDDPIFLTVTESVLRAFGIVKVTSTTDGNEALGYVSENPARFDLAVIDLNMPKIDGFAFLRAIAEAGFKGRIVIVSGEKKTLLTSAERISERLGLKILGALSKPLKASELKMLVAAARKGASDGEEFKLPGLRAGEDVLEPLLHYQAQVDAASGEVVGAEALLRSRKADGTLQGPMPILEAHSSDEDRFDLTLRLFSSLCADVQWMRREGCTNRVGFNVDVPVMEDDRLAPLLLQTLNGTGLAPADVKLEVTESQLAKDSSRLLEGIARVSMNGFEVSLDDFGVGGSNFELLREAAFDELKIDQSIVRSASTDRASRIFLESIVDISRSLGIRLVAEGVETEDEKEFCLSAGINILQGFLLAYPCEREKFIQYACPDRKKAAYG